MNAKAVIVLANTGKTAQFCSKYSSTMPIITCVGDTPSDMKVGRQLGLSRSIVPMSVANTDFASRPQEATRLAKEMGLVGTGDLVVMLTTTESSTLTEGISMTV